MHTDAQENSHSVHLLAKERGGVNPFWRQIRRNADAHAMQTTPPRNLPFVRDQPTIRAAVTPTQADTAVSTVPQITSVATICQCQSFMMA